MANQLKRLLLSVVIMVNEYRGAPSALAQQSNSPAILVMSPSKYM